MTAVPFVTLKLARALREQAHFSSEQAEGAAGAIAEALQTELATKADLEVQGTAFRSDLAAMEASLRNEMTAMDSGLKNEMAAIEARLRAEFKKEFAALSKEFSESKADSLKWMVGAIGFQTVIMVGTLITMVHMLRP